MLAKRKHQGISDLIKKRECVHIWEPNNIRKPETDGDSFSVFIQCKVCQLKACEVFHFGWILTENGDIINK
jgi:hypothetical protein